MCRECACLEYMNPRIKKIVWIVLALILLSAFIGGGYGWYLNWSKQDMSDLVGQQVSTEGRADDQLGLNFFSLKKSTLKADHGVYVIAPFGNSRIQVMGTVQLFDLQKYNDGTQQPIPNEKAALLSGKPVIIANSVMVLP
jgi:hypothetical protein